jgi:hypothetical protein
MVSDAFIDIYFDGDGMCFHTKDGASVDFFEHLSKFENLNLLNITE